MPGSRNRTGTDPSLNHPLTMSYMGAGSGWEKRPGRRDFHPPLPGGIAARRGAGWGLLEAQLNFGVCLSYACAKAQGAKLLFKGENFARTDVARENLWLSAAKSGSGN